MDNLNVLENKVLVYDDNCPLCKAYSAAFVRKGILPAQGRCGYAQAPAHIHSRIDHERYRMEIALIDHSGAPTLYGVDSLFFLLGSHYPRLQALFRQAWFYRAAKRLYRFISYNRKVIAPFHKNPDAPDCTPAFSFRHRMAFIVLCIVLASAFTAAYGAALSGVWPQCQPDTLAVCMLLLAGTGWVVLMALGSLLPRGQQRMAYLAQLAVLMVIGSGLLMPFAGLAVLIARFWGLCPALIPLSGIVLSFSIMLRQHISRMRALQLSQAWTAAWLIALGSTALGWLYIFSLQTSF